MSLINVQGSKVLIADVPLVDWADCAEAITGLLAGVEALCPQSLGELVRTRETTELSCVSNNSSVKATGKVSYGDFAIDLLFDETDILGQDKLYTAMNDNTPVMLGIQSIDGDVVFTEALIMGDAISYPDGSKVGYNVILSPYGGFYRCGSAALLPKDCALSIGGLSAMDYELGGFLYDTCNIFKG